MNRIMIYVLLLMNSVAVLADIERAQEMELKGNTTEAPSWTWFDYTTTSKPIITISPGHNKLEFFGPTGHSISINLKTGEVHHTYSKMSDASADFWKAVEIAFPQVCQKNLTGEIK